MNTIAARASALLAATCSSTEPPPAWALFMAVDNTLENARVEQRGLRALEERLALRDLSALENASSPWSEMHAAHNATVRELERLATLDR